MEITINQADNQITLSLSGRLDTTTAPQFEAMVAKAVTAEKLILDFSTLEYVSSAGLRVLLMAQKQMAGHGEMVITGANADIKDVFDITGFSDILTIL